MKVLLIGGTGVLSTPVMLSAMQKGYEVTIVNRGNRKNLIPDSVRLIRCDIRDRESFASAMKGESFDVTVDFLSYTKEQMLSTLSVVGSETEQYIFISSCCSYDRTLFSGRKIADSDMPTGNPRWSYGENKLRCERELFENHADSFFTVVRPYITYGDTRIPYGITPASRCHWTLISRIMNGKPLFLWDDGNAVTTITHTDDFARGVTGLFRNPQARGKAFNVAGDHSLTWNDFLLVWEKVIGRPIPVVRIPSEFAAKTIPSQAGILLGDRALDARFDNRILKSVVPDFHDTVSLEDGLKRTIEYYRTHHYLNGINYAWDGMMDFLIRRWCMVSGEKNPGPSFFIDYLKNATVKDRLHYFYHRFFKRAN